MAPREGRAVSGEEPGGPKRQLAPRHVRPSPHSPQGREHRPGWHWRLLGAVGAGVLVLAAAGEHGAQGPGGGLCRLLRSAATSFSAITGAKDPGDRTVLLGRRYGGQALSERLSACQFS